MEQYVPLPEERDRHLQRHQKMSLSGDGIFATIQGEGVTAGAPAVFLRLQDCNLHCGKDNIGWQCDAWYTWDKTTPEFWKERSNRDIEDVAQDVNSAWLETFSDIELDQRLVITGGEPLLQQVKIASLLDMLKEWDVEIETNGTVVPHESLTSCQFNCSPKLASSGNSLRTRYRPEAIKAIASMPDSWFKFVVSVPKDEEEISSMIEECNIPPQRVLIMSEGTDTKTLSAHNPHIVQVANRIGGTAIERNHIFWFGDKRRA